MPHWASEVRQLVQTRETHGTRARWKSRAASALQARGLRFRLRDVMPSLDGVVLGFSDGGNAVFGFTHEPSGAVRYWRRWLRGFPPRAAAEDAVPGGAAQRRPADMIDACTASCMPLMPGFLFFQHESDVVYSATALDADFQPWRAGALICSAPLQMPPRRRDFGEAAGLCQSAARVFLFSRHAPEAGGGAAARFAAQRGTCHLSLEGFAAFPAGGSCGVLDAERLIDRAVRGVPWLGEQRVNFGDPLWTYELDIVRLLPGTGIGIVQVMFFHGELRGGAAPRIIVTHFAVDCRSGDVALFRCGRMDGPVLLRFARALHGAAERLADVCRHGVFRPFAYEIAAKYAEMEGPLPSEGRRLGVLSGLRLVAGTSATELRNPAYHYALAL